MTAKLIVANWKMNGNIKKIEDDLKFYVNNKMTNRVNVVIAAPSVYLPIVNQILKNSYIKIASQDVSRFANKGAYTGEISATMLCDLGVKYALVGHSERRFLIAEDGSILLSKLENLLNNDIIPIFCIGEPKQIRDSGNYLEFLITQMELLVQVSRPFTHLVVAYEPVWSIGTGILPSDEQIMEVVNVLQAFVQSYLVCDKITVLYGGSVSSKNIENILRLPLDGVLVGGASLIVEEFTTICSIE